MKARVIQVLCVLALGIYIVPSAGTQVAVAADATGFSYPMTGWSGRPIGFGYGDDWKFGTCGGQYEQHPAVDRMAHPGEPVYAAANGTVYGVLKDPRWGYGILIRHAVPNEGTVMTQYWHVNPMVHKGDAVQGSNLTQIGTIYDLGNNSHIHFAVFKMDADNYAWRGHLPRNNCYGSPGFQYKFTNPEIYVNSHQTLSGSVPPPPTYAAPSTPPAGPMWISNGPVDRNVDGRLELVSQTIDVTVAHNWQAVPNGDWAGWLGYGFEESLGSASKPVLVHNQDGRLEAFALWFDGSIRHTYQCGQNGVAGYRCPNDWQASWLNFTTPTSGGPARFISNPAVAIKPEGRLEVFAVGSDNALWHMWQTSANFDWTYTWESLGGSWAGSRLAVTQNPDGRLEVFGMDPSGNLLHVYQCGTYCSTAWSPSASLGGGFNPNFGPAIGTDSSDGRIEVFAIKSDGSMSHMFQCGPYCSGPWSTWNPTAGGPFTSNPVMGRNANGALEVVALSGNSTYHVWQKCAGCDWYGTPASIPSFQPLGGPAPVVALDNLGVALNADGRLEVFVQDSDSHWYHNFQCGTICSTGWYGWADLGLPNVIGSPGTYQ